MKKIDISNKLFHFLMPILLGTVVGIIFKDYMNYINELERTILVPTIVFPIAWSILYVMIGVWYDNFSNYASSKDIIIYYILLGINLMFTPILFYFKQIIIALSMVIVLLIGNIYLFTRSNKQSKLTYLLILYIVWLMFALTLMFDLFVNNII